MTVHLGDKQKYFPIEKGQYTTEPGLKKPGSPVFEIDHEWPLYISNKKFCCRHHPARHYARFRLNPVTENAICQFIIQQLLTHHPAFFQLDTKDKIDELHCRLSGEKIIVKDNKHNLSRDLFDALCRQIQEDVAVLQFDDTRNWLSLAHICAPNFWSAAEKIGKSFADIHETVPGMIKNQTPMLRAILQKGSFERFGWGITYDARLNHHPVPLPGIEAHKWHNRVFQADKPLVYLRVERQTLTGFSKEQAILFTIRTYLYPASELRPESLEKLVSAISGMDDETRKYKGLYGQWRKVCAYLEELKKKDS
ncbi:MAG: DUF3445 domain-containing protein [Cyclobacteriaceae bacterium]|nr:DUF3445 domain-containing protein [Cyclobacteriaceae bacterium]